MVKLRWDAPAMLAIKKKAGDSSFFYEPHRNDALASLIDYVLVQPVAKQSRFHILSDDHPEPIDIAKIHQLRCRADFPG